MLLLSLVFKTSPLAIEALCRSTILIAQYFVEDQLAEFTYVVYDWESWFKKASNNINITSLYVLKYSKCCKSLSLQVTKYDSNVII